MFDYIVDATGGGDFLTVEEAVSRIDHWPRWRKWLYRLPFMRMQIVVAPGVYKTPVITAPHVKLAIRGGTYHA